MEQEACAEDGDIQQTFQRILSAARQKIADSLVSGKAIRIEGGIIQGIYALLNVLIVENTGTRV